MITNDIQEFLDGALSDEQTAELLHALSVSPEKRTELRDYLALQSAFQRDRSASALAPNEDAALWASIVGPGTAVAAPAGGVRWGLFVKTAAVVVAGVVGYILGSTTLDLDQQNGTARIDRAPAPASAPAVSSNSGVAQTRVELRHDTVYRDRILYRDRIVYRDRPAAASSLGSLTERNGAPDANTPRVESPQVAPSAPPVTPNVPLSMPEQKPAQQNVNGTDVTSPQALPKDTSTGERNEARLNDPKKENPNAVAPNTQPNIASLPDVDVPVNTLMLNGFEAAFVERFSLMTKASASIENADASFSYRTFGLAYRFFDGQIAVGGRGAFGSLPVVDLATDTSQVQNENGSFAPESKNKALSQNNLWLEGFASYRLPVLDFLAIDFEASAGGSSDYYKLTGSLVAVFKLTDAIGAQIGGGFGRYWQSVNEDAQLEWLKSVESGGVRELGGQDGWIQGPVLEGRYGLFIHF